MLTFSWLTVKMSSSFFIVNIWPFVVVELI